MDQTFGQYIRSLREKKGLTQRALSAEVGFRSLAHLSDIESGKRHPARDTLPKFAQALGVSLEDLESRDVRGPVEAVKTLFAFKPEMVGAFLKVIEVARNVSAEELVRRVSAVPSSPRKKEPAPEPVVPNVVTTPREPAPAVVSVEAPAEPQKVAPEAPSKRDDQPTLF